jgi:hypothetical protein
MKKGASQQLTEKHQEQTGAETGLAGQPRPAGCGAPGFHPELLNLKSGSTVLTLVK